MSDSEDALKDMDGDDDLRIEDDEHDGSNANDSDDGEFDEDDFEDDDLDEGDDHLRKRARFFLDEEAEVSDDDDGEGDEDIDDYEKDDVDESELQEAEAAATSRSSYRRLAESSVDDDINEEELERLNSRYERYSYQGEGEDSGGRAGGADMISRRKDLPSTKDPKLWLVKCKTGHERRIVMGLLQTFFEKKGHPDELMIKSAISCDHLKGYIYIEAERVSHVQHAINNVRNIRKWTLKLVDLKEMPAVLRVPRQSFELEPNAWVRVRRGVYKGDLGQVVDMDDTRTVAQVKIIPRLDIAEIMGAKDRGDDGSLLKKRKRSGRPPARFFNPEDVEQYPGFSDFLHDDRDYDGEKIHIFNNEKYRNGFLYKSFNLKSLDTQSIQPSLDELQKFQARGNGADAEDDLLQAVARARPKSKVVFSKGELVIVTSGELQYLTGTVKRIDGDNVIITPQHKDLKSQDLEIPAAQLRKYFTVGNHVKVTAGRYEGETGLIVSIDEDALTSIIFSDTMQEEIKILLNDIIVCSETSSGRLAVGQYGLHDLVQIGQQTVGVIVRIDRAGCKVMDTTGTIQTIKMQALGRKRQSSSGLDRNQNRLGPNDSVTVVEGKFKGKQGTVKHIYRYYAFLHSKEELQNSGIFVVRTSNCSVVGGSSSKSSRAYGFGGAFPPRDVLASPRRSDGGGGGGNVFAPPSGGGGRSSRFGRNRDPLLDKTVVVTKAPYKGMLGIVKECTDTGVRVELHAHNKIINVERNKVREKQTSEGGYEDHAYRFGDGTRTPVHHGSMTPLRTPGAPGTPMRTPGRDNTWDPSHPNTPGREPWTPGTGDYTPTPYGLYSPAPMGGVSATTPHTPSDQQYNPFTPAPYSAAPAADTPYSPYTPGESTPHAFPATPATPGAGLPHTPGTPGTPGVYSPAVGYDASYDYQDDVSWATSGIQVRVANESAAAVVRSVNADRTCTIETNDGRVRTNVAIQSLKPVPPQSKGDRVKILRGEMRDAIGALASLDNEEAVIEINDDYQIYQMADLALVG